MQPCKTICFHHVLPIRIPWMAPPVVHSASLDGSPPIAGWFSSWTIQQRNGWLLRVPPWLKKPPYRRLIRLNGSFFHCEVKLIHIHIYLYIIYISIYILYIYNIYTHMYSYIFIEGKQHMVSCSSFKTHGAFPDWVMAVPNRPDRSHGPNRNRWFTY